MPGDVPTLPPCSLSPIQQLTSTVLESEIHLFSLRQAYRFHNVAAPISVEDEQFVGAGPDYGASINCYLKSPPAEDVQISILDSAGQLIRTLEGTKMAGINRVMWDLEHEPSKKAVLRTNNRYAPHVTGDPRTQTRPMPSGGTVSPRAVPGSYTVRLSVGQEELSRTLIVKKDPNSAGSEADIEAQVAMSLEVRDNLNTLMDMINQIEWVRRQIYDVSAVLREIQNTEEILNAGDALDQKLIAVEERLFQINQTPGADFWRWKTVLYGKFLEFSSSLTATWGAGGHDFTPITQHVEVHELLKGRLADYHAQLKQVIDTDLPAFNNQLRSKNLSILLPSLQ